MTDNVKPPSDLDLAHMLAKLMGTKEVKMTVSIEIPLPRKTAKARRATVEPNPDNPIMFSTVDEVRKWLAEQHEPPDDGRT